MSQRIRVALSIALPLSSIATITPMRAYAQASPTSVPPNPYAEVATADPTPPHEAHAARTLHDENDGTPGPDDQILELVSAATRAQPPSPPISHAMSELDEVLSGNASDPIEGTEHFVQIPAADAGLPSRAETAAAIERVMPWVRACVADRAHGLIELRIVFVSNGRVTTAYVEPRSARLSPRQCSCIARAARRAQVERFERRRFEVTYPIRL